MAHKLYRNKYKGIKWIDSPFSTQRKMLAKFFCASIAASGFSQINAIKNSNALTEEEIAKKRIAIAKTVMKTASIMRTTLKDVLYGKTK